MHDEYIYWEMDKDKFKKFCDDYYIKEDLLPNMSGVLLSQNIKYLSVEGKMIQPFDEDFLKPAAYMLRIGPKFAKGDPPQEFENNNGVIRLEPFEVAILSTYEIVNLPYNIIARWNLRVDMVYKGLLWTGALQVDPGWCGPLYCPIYNLSDKPVDLFYKEKFVTMDFVKTTNVKYENITKYTKRGKAVNLRDYEYNLRSALVSEAADKIKSMESDLNKFHTRLDSYISIIFAILAILITAFSIFFTSTENVSDVNFATWFKIWMIFISIIAITSLYFSMKKK